MNFSTRYCNTRKEKEKVAIINNTKYRIGISVIKK